MAERSSAGELVSLDRVEILLVDDDRAWARTTGRLLEEARPGFVVEVANSLSAGRDRFGELDPDCVVSDYQLGDGTGLALLETVREVDPNRPFLLVTGRGSESVASEAIGADVTDYIRKHRDDDAAEFLASRVANAARSYRTERALERERTSKNAMLDILTATAGRSDLSQQFCSQLVEGRGYACAWIGSLQGSETVVPLASAGRDGYLDETGIPDTRTTPGPASPAVAALTGGEPVVVDQLEGHSAGPPDDAADGPAEWLVAARDYGFESAAAVPIRHDGVRFGVLAVYAADGTTIDPAERLFLEEYAETVGYAHRTAEWKRSLLSEGPVRVDVEIRDAAVPLVALHEHLDCPRVDVVTALDRSDGETLLLTEVHGSTAEAVRAAGTAVDGIVAIDVADAASPLRCDVIVASRTPETVLADNGARFERTVIERGTATVTALVPDDGRVSAIAQALEAVYDETELSTIWTERTDPGSAEVRDPLAPLTDRQREIITYAFHHGYFELPRSANGTDLAKKFDISRATLSHHLRRAQSKLFDQLLGSDEGT